jgi:hypothetical protein
MADWMHRVEKTNDAGKIRASMASIAERVKGEDYVRSDNPEVHRQHQQQIACCEKHVSQFLDVMPAGLNVEIECGGATAGYVIAPSFTYYLTVRASAF